MCMYMISAVTIAPAHHAHIDRRRTRNHPRIDRARVVPRTDTDTTYDDEGATRATRTRARLNGISPLDSNKFVSNNILYIYVYKMNIRNIHMYIIITCTL